MFYEHPSFRKVISNGAPMESAIITLTPAESKRLIAKAIAILPEIKAVMKKGTLVVNWGTTNAFVVEEVLNRTIPCKADFASGVVSEGELNANHPETKILPFVVKDGKLSEVHQKAALRDFKPGDVFLKGANALDTRGDIGILVGAHTAGSIYDAWLAVSVRGGCFICPVGLEKLVPSVNEAAEKCGVFRFKYSMGVPVSLVVFSMAKVVTEVQAIKVLSGADAYHVASGGIGGSEGAVTIVLEGETDTLEQAFKWVKCVKGESPLLKPRRYIAPPATSANYDPVVLSEYVQEDVRHRQV